MKKGQQVGLHVPPGGKIKPTWRNTLVPRPAAKLSGLPQGRVVLHLPCSFPLGHLVTLQNRILHSAGPIWQLVQLGLWTEKVSYFADCSILAQSYCDPFPPTTTTIISTTVAQSAAQWGFPQGSKKRQLKALKPSPAQPGPR